MKKLTRSELISMVDRRCDRYKNQCRDKNSDSKEKLKNLGAWNALEELLNSIKELEGEE